MPWSAEILSTKRFFMLGNNNSARITGKHSFERCTCAVDRLYPFARLKQHKLGFGVQRQTQIQKRFGIPWLIGRMVMSIKSIDMLLQYFFDFRTFLLICISKECWVYNRSLHLFVL
jgi:hypothetical protein